MEKDRREIMDQKNREVSKKLIETSNKMILYTVIKQNIRDYLKCYIENDFLNQYENKIYNNTEVKLKTSNKNITIVELLIKRYELNNVEKNQICHKCYKKFYENTKILLKYGIINTNNVGGRLLNYPSLITNIFKNNPKEDPILELFTHIGKPIFIELFNEEKSKDMIKYLIRTNPINKTTSR